MAKTTMGRPALYLPKTEAFTVRSVTADCRLIAEEVRGHLVKLSKWKGSISDADVTEYLTRVWSNGRVKADAYVRRRGKG